MLRDPEFRELLEIIYPFQQTQTRFNRMVLGAVRRKSVTQVRAVLFAMRCKVRVLGILRKQNEV